LAHPNHQIARKFFAALFSGNITDDLLTSDMSAWTTLGPMDKVAYQGGVKAVMSLFAVPPASVTYTIDALTAEDERVAAEIRSKGTFTDGEGYEMNYVFVLRIREGRIASVAEHFNPVPVMEKIFPRMQPAMAKASP
jgi:ketosteroid isomerase-like protein